MTEDELTTEDRIKIAGYCRKRDHKLIDLMTTEQTRDALKYLCDRTHNKDGSPVMLVFDTDMIIFEEENPGKGNDCFSHTLADALESAGVDLEKEVDV